MFRPAGGFDRREGGGYNRGGYGGGGGGYNNGGYRGDRDGGFNSYDRPRSGFPSNSNPVAPGSSALAEDSFGGDYQAQVGGTEKVDGVILFIFTFLLS